MAFAIPYLFLLIIYHCHSGSNEYTLGLKSVLIAPSVAVGTPCCGTRIGKCRVGAMKMREGVGSVDIECSRNGMLAREKFVALYNVGSKRADSGLVAVNRDLVECRAVLMDPDFNAVALDLVFKVEFISQLAAVEGKSLFGN